MKLQRMALFLGLFALVACGGQGIDNGNPTHDAGTGGATGTGGSTGNGGSTGGSTGTGGAPQAEVDVLVTYGTDSVKVNIAALTTQDYKGVTVVPLTSVWTSSKLHPDLTTLQFDFEGDDGFHPSNKTNCAAYVTGAQLAQGYILPDTRTLVWDDALGFPGCYSVKAVAKIIGLDAGQ
jgi:hypothetical protein